jgi:hypothetical protein
MNMKILLLRTENVEESIEQHKTHLLHMFCLPTFQKGKKEMEVKKIIAVCTIDF